jgi:phage baseplate assembly protein gpV
MKAIEVIKKIAEDEAKKLHIVELGIVTSIFPHSEDTNKDNYECNVKLKNRDLELRKIPIATQHIGFTYVPNIGDLVLLAFVNGNINAPVVIGRLYNDEDRPPVNNPGEIIFESPDPKKSGVRRMYLKFPGGIVLTITDDELKAEVGKSVISIKTDGDIIIESNAKLDIKAKGAMSFSAQNIKLEAQANLDIKGAMININ